MFFFTHKPLAELLLWQIGQANSHRIKHAHYKSFIWYSNHVSPRGNLEYEISYDASLMPNLKTTYLDTGDFDVLNEDVLDATKGQFKNGSTVENLILELLKHPNYRRRV